MKRIIRINIVLCVFLAGILIGFLKIKASENNFISEETTFVNNHEEINTIDLIEKSLEGDMED